MSTLANKAGDRSLMSKVFDMVQDPAVQGTTLGDISSLAGSTAATAPSLSLGSRFLSTLFGGGMDSIGRALSSFAGIRSSSATSILSLAAPMVMGYLGKLVRNHGLDAGGLSSMLVGQRSALSRMVPSAFPSVLDSSTRVADTVVQKASPLRWVVPVLLVLLALWGLSRLAGIRNPVSEISRMIPGGIQLHYPKTGVEGKLLSFIEDPRQSLNAERWFDFDRLLFNTNSAVLKPESQPQLQNIAAILKSYPSVTVKIGGYTDTSGDAAFNMKLSQDRADSVMHELTDMGISPHRLSAQGYGGGYPIADNATEAGRAQNRRVAIKVTAR